MRPSRVFSSDETLRGRVSARLLIAALILSGCIGDDKSGTETAGQTSTSPGTDTATATSSDTAVTDSDTGCEPFNPCREVECGCPDPDVDPDCNRPLLYHDTNMQLVWNGSGCTTCHSGMNPAGDLSLSTQDEPFCSLVNKPSSGPSLKTLVLPGQPYESLLWHKLRNTQDCPDIGDNGSHMPPPPDIPMALDEEDGGAVQFSLITEWICCGAYKSPADPGGESSCAGNP